MEKTKFQKIIRMLGSIGVAVTLVVIAVNVFRSVNGPDQKKILDEIKIEFNRINKLPSASVVDERYAAFIDKTSVDVSYSSYSLDEEIQEYYNAELLRNGWQLSEEKKIRDWGRDLGGKVFVYTKLKFKLSLQYAGDRKGYGWAYDIFIKLK